MQKSLTPGQTSRFARTRGRSSISAPTAFSLLQLILYPEEGEPLKLDNGFIGFEGLAGEIERKVRRRLLPDAIAAYESGQSRNFGMLDVTPQGLSLEHDQKALPWERLGSVEVRGEDVIIRESGAKAEWARINVAEMLNICILLPLIDHVQRARIKKLNSEPKILGYRLPTGALSQQSEWQDYEQ